MALRSSDRTEAASALTGPGRGGDDPLDGAPHLLRVVALHDPVVDEVGHDPRSVYVETYWLPVLGPSTVWLLRRFAAELDDAPAGAELEVDDLARRLGIGERRGSNSPFARTLKRCVDFQMASWQRDVLAVRRRLPPLARRHLRRLPESLQREHELAEQWAPAPRQSERVAAHGRRLALSLLEYGDDRAAAEATLVRWGFHPTHAAECSTAAALEHARRLAARQHAAEAAYASRRPVARRTPPSGSAA